MIPKHIQEAVGAQLLKMGSTKFNALRGDDRPQKLKSALPKNAKMVDDRTGEHVTKLDEFLVKYLQIPLQYRQFALLVYDKDQYVAGITFERMGQLPESFGTGQWYWPTRSTDLMQFDHREPRYNNLRDAIVLSLKETGDSAYVVVRRRWDGHYESAGIKVIEWFNNPDFVERGTVEAWWDEQLARLQPKSVPVLWKGSDDSMR